jgi:hypothetical protein
MDRKPIKDPEKLPEVVLIGIIDRITHIQQILRIKDDFAEAILEIDKIEKFLDVWTLNIALSELICILYRSLFQEAEWIEGEAWNKIEPNFFFDDFFSWAEKHNSIIEFATKVLAHQDAKTPSRKIILRETPGAVNKIRYSLPDIDILNQKLHKAKEKMVQSFKRKFGVTPTIGRKFKIE